MVGNYGAMTGILIAAGAGTMLDRLPAAVCGLARLKAIGRCRK
jgi:hypothetical protein